MSENVTEAERYISPLSIVTISAPKPARGLAPRIYSEPFLAIPAKIGLSDDSKEALEHVRIPQRCKDWFVQDDFDAKKILGKHFWVRVCHETTADFT